ncbi:IclR family transcriptional regulator [Sporosarcina sp. PTS2304]|uniref:IclR family transcriptional regulator n=1 Tax=Sporosarcina sp. PTS2304 TaxID=2283194 RepID=UPI0013B3764B|nr:IclR family transcriptional regulator [Sporosarcina sp. PTS2304]
MANHVPAVVTAFNIVEFLSKSEWKSSSMTQISEMLNLNKSTCFRVLKTLESLGYIKFDDLTKQYSLGYRFVVIGERAKQMNTYISAVSTILEKIAHPEITFVIVKRTSDNFLAYVAKQEPTLPIRLQFSGDMFPIPYGALGKCFLSYLPKDEQVSILEKQQINGVLPQYTTRTNTSLAQLQNELETIRSTGFAESDMEYIDTISSIACPILDENGEIILGLGAYILSHYKPLIDTDSVKKLLKSTAEEISEAIIGLEIY